MTSNRAWENNIQNPSSLRQGGQSVLCSGTNARSAPLLPPRPDNHYRPSGITPYSGYGGSTYGSYGGLGSYGSLSSYGGPSSYGSYGLHSMYNSYGGYNGMGMYGVPGVYGSVISDDAERRFIQYAEESSRKTFSNVESIVRAFGSIAMMLDNTFFAMTSSFRAVLSVAENFGRLRTTFSQIWYSVSVFRFMSWLYRKLMEALGRKPRSSASAAWNQAAKGISSGIPKGSDPSSQSSWPTIAFLGVLASAPYIISKFLPKYEDKSDMSCWKSPGVSAKAAFDFTGNNNGEMSIATNDDVVIAPMYIQESMKLRNTGWAYALSNGKSGLVPLNYLLLNKSNKKPEPMSGGNFTRDNSFIKKGDTNNWFTEEITADPENTESKTKTKTHTKRVSFGENQIFENIDLDYSKKDVDCETKQLKSSLKNINQDNDKNIGCDTVSSENIP